MRTKLFLALGSACLGLAGPALADQAPAIDAMAGMHGSPIHRHFVVETGLSRSHGLDAASWDVDGWTGTDINKLWLKSEGEITGGKTDQAELWALYSRNVAAFWDAQAGLRYDAKPNRPGAKAHTYLAAGVTGLAPYWFETEAHLFVRDDGVISARLRQENEWLLTQKLVLKPRLEVNLNSRKDIAAGIGTGITDASLGLQARYEFRREFAPYVDITYRKNFGETADLARARAEKPDETRVSIGVRWVIF